MEIGKRYQVTKWIKIHTKPLRVVNVTLVGTFKYDTDSWYYFNEFKAKKSNVIEIKER
jgi:hypothetical protein